MGQHWLPQKKNKPCVVLNIATPLIYYLATPNFFVGLEEIILKKYL
jgi:hypothetical protein